MWIWFRDVLGPKVRILEGVGPQVRACVSLVRFQDPT